MAYALQAADMHAHTLVLSGLVCPRIKRMGHLVSRSLDVCTAPIEYAAL